MKGGLNVRDDTLFNKLDFSSKSDVSKLVKIQKTINRHSNKKQIDDSLEIIQENLNKLEVLGKSKSSEASTGDQSDDQNNKKIACILDKVYKNLNSNNFVKYTTNLCKIFYELCREEKILCGDSKEEKILCGDSNNSNDSNERVNKILENLKYFKIYAIHYQPGKFLNIINKVEKILLHQDQENNKNLQSLYDEFENFKYIFELDVYYSIIYGQSLLEKITECNEQSISSDIHKILISRIKVLDKIYSEIRNIVTDPTLKTLEKLYTGENFYENLQLKEKTHVIDIKEWKAKLVNNSDCSPSTPSTPEFSKDIKKQLNDIFGLEDDVQDNDFLKAYKSKLEDSLKGGAFDIQKPVTSLQETIKIHLVKYPTPILTLNEIKQITGGELKQQQQEFIDNLKTKIENVNPDDEQVESISDSAQRYANKIFSDVKNAIDKKPPIVNTTKILDDKYENVLKDFDPNKISNIDYAELRKTIYKIKNSEFFDNIQIENEDIYMFIAATYVIRVLSLHMTTWFIEIEILKDIESVILSYIMIYVLIFLLIYTFVNLSDNKLNSTKSYLYYFYSRVNFDYTRFIIHLGILLLLIIIPFVIRVTDKESSGFKQTSDQKKHYLNKLISNMSAIVWVILSIIAFLFK